MSELLRDLRDIEPVRVWDGALARPVHAGNLTLAVVELSPRSVVPLHSHSTEQLGIVLAGSIHFTLGAERKVLGAGGTYHIPSGVPHEVVAGPDGAVVVDAFAPPRADWASLPPLPTTTPHWP